MTPLDRILTSPSLPSLPTVAVRLLELSRDPKASSADFIATVQSDAAITAKVLKLANSSYLGIRSSVTTLQKAVTFLGTRSVTSMALGFSIARQSVGTGDLANAFDKFWQRSVLQAAACEVLSDRQSSNSSAELLLAGLMADIGQLAMLRALGQDYADLLSAGLTGKQLLDAERAKFEFDHQEAGGGLLRLWNFPPHLAACAASHHLCEVDSRSNARPTPEGVAAEGDDAASDADLHDLQSACAVASAAADYFLGGDPSQGLTVLRDVCRTTYEMCDAATHDLCEAIAERFRTNAELFEADSSNLPEPEELLAAANEQLAERAVQAQLEHSKAEEMRRELEAVHEVLLAENRLLRNQTVIDSLTGCYNRAFFDETLTKEVDVCRRTARPLGLLFIDIDNFKGLNDTHGHQFGDHVLSGVAECLMKVVRESDVLCRYGGEEFVMLARQPTESGLRAVAERLRRGIEEKSFFHNGVTVSVTASIGGARAIPSLQDHNVAVEIVREADRAMYACKLGGRNQTEVRSLVTPDETALREEAQRARFSVFLMRQGVLNVDILSRALAHIRLPTARIGEIAVEHGVLSPDQVAEVIERQNAGNRRERFGEIAIAEGMFDRAMLAALLGYQQEDAIELARSLVTMGCVLPDEMAASVEEYNQSLFGSEAVRRRTSTPAAQPTPGSAALCRS